mgnify:CR=1 FL=1
MSMRDLSRLPEWARQLSEKYYSGAFTLFILHGNVRDSVPWTDDGETRHVPLPVFLESALFGARDLCLQYDRGGGLRFSRPEAQADFRAALEGYDSFHGTSHAREGIPRSPERVLGLLDNYLHLRVLEGKKIALVIDFAETIAPAGDVQGMSAEDRNALVILKRWAADASLRRADVTICLVAENLVELHQGIAQSPGVAAVNLPLPDERARAEAAEVFLCATPLPAGSELDAPLLARLGAGLKRVQIQSLIAEAVENARPLTMKFLAARKKELIEAESGGLLEFVQSRYDLSYVAGHEPAKQLLRDAASAIRAGRGDVLPMGYVICGPVGTGKTFLASCFAGEVGIPAVILKNFRSMWQGVTEGNLERVLHLLPSMSPVVVMVDEADAQLGDRSSSGDSGVNNRVFAQIAQFMGNTEHRGKVVWFLLTCRPDLLPVDLKRQGRAEEHIALFYPEGDEERLALLRAMQKKTGIPPLSPEVEQLFLQRARGLSGADIEAVLVRARMRGVLEGVRDGVRELGGPTATPEAGRAPDAVSAADLQEALEDFIPPSYPSEIELQNLVAVLECTSRRLLPERFRDVDRAEAMRRARELATFTSSAGMTG